MKVFSRSCGQRSRSPSDHGENLVNSMAREPNKGICSKMYIKNIHYTREKNGLGFQGHGVRDQGHIIQVRE